MAISLALCLRAQKQALDARDKVRPQYGTKYAINAPPVAIMHPARREFSDVVSQRTYCPADGVKLYKEWEKEGNKLV